MYSVFTDAFKDLKYIFIIFYFEKDISPVATETGELLLLMLLMYWRKLKLNRLSRDIKALI